MINLKAPTGTRVELTEQLIKRVEAIISEEVAPPDLGVIVANIGVQPGFSSIYTSNSGQHTATVQISLNSAPASAATNTWRAFGGGFARICPS